TEDLIASGGMRHDRCDGIGWRSKPAPGGAGIPDFGGSKQIQSPNLELRFCHAGAQYSERPTAGGKLAQGGHRRRRVFTVAAAKTQHLKDFAKVSEDRRTGSGGGLSRSRERNG